MSTQDNEGRGRDSLLRVLTATMDSHVLRPLLAHIYVCEAAFESLLYTSLTRLAPDRPMSVSTISIPLKLG